MERKQRMATPVRVGIWAATVAVAVIVGCIQRQADRPDTPEGAKTVVVFFDREAADDMAVYCDKQLDRYCHQHGDILRVYPLDVVDERGKAAPAYLSAYTKAATGKKLPCVVVGSAGVVTKVLEQPADAQAIIAFLRPKVSAGEDGGDSEGVEQLWFDGHWRKMGLRPVALGAAERLGLPVEGDNKNEPLIPREKWRNSSMLEFLPPIKDQNGYSSCCPTSGNTTLEATAARSRLPYVELSALDAYARINGGRDAGASLESYLNAAQTEGVCSVEYCPAQGWKQPIRKPGFQTSRSKNRVLFATWCPTRDAIGSALMRKRVVQFGISVTSQFQPDRDGKIGKKRSRGGGGHAVVAIGFRLIDGEVYYEMVNSWGEDWGGSADGSVPKGCCLLHESWAEPMFGAWSCVAVVAPSDDRLAETLKPLSNTVGGRSPTVYAMAN